MNTNEKKDYIIQMVKLVESEIALDYMIDYLQIEISDETKKGLNNSP